jgi:hypothetical protein
MSNAVLVRNLVLTSFSLLALPACIDGMEEDGNVDLESDDSEATISPSLCPSNTPASLAPAADQHLAFVLDATGIQRYSCNPTATGGQAWALVQPVADLFNDCGDKVGTHYAGPTWEYKDGSTVAGAKAAGVTVDASSVQWLLLSVVGHGGPYGKMTPVTAIQRLVTAGGLAPTNGCVLGTTIDVPYTTKYFFYKTRTRNMQSNIRCGAQ